MKRNDSLIKELSMENVELKRQLERAKAGVDGINRIVDAILAEVVVKYGKGKSISIKKPKVGTYQIETKSEGDEFVVSIIDKEKKDA